jgi:hypothetical protein
MLSRLEMLRNVEKCISNFIDIFRENPLNFLNEENLCATLYSNLSGTIDRTDYVKLPLNIWTKTYKDSDIFINPWRAEYPEENKKTRSYTQIYNAGKFDIAFISETDNPVAFSSDITVNHYMLPVSVAIELKLRFNGFKVQNLICDYKKLKSYRNVKHFVGLALLFEQKPQSKWDEQYKSYENSNFTFTKTDKIIIEDDRIYAIHIYPDSKDLFIHSESYNLSRAIKTSQPGP